LYNFITFYSQLSFRNDTNKIPTITTKAPNNCSHVNTSPKKIPAKIMVEIGPAPATMAKFEELIMLMDFDTKNDGMTVAITAIKNPSTYTSLENPKMSALLTIKKWMNTQKQDTIMAYTVNLVTPNLGISQPLPTKYTA